MYLDASDNFDRIFETYSDERTTEAQLRFHELLIKTWSEAIAKTTNPDREQELEERLFMHRLIRIYLLGLLHGEGGRQPRLQVITGGAHKSGPRP